MTGRLPRPCAHPGCPEIVTEGPRCPQHLSAYRKEQDAARPKTAARGYGGRHRKWREVVLARYPLCVDCQSAGKIVPSIIADHIVALNDWGDRDGSPWSLENGQGLCMACHNRKIVRETRARQKRVG